MKKRNDISENMPESMNAGNAENIRENIWLYRVYNGLSRYQMAEGITKPGHIDLMNMASSPSPISTSPPLPTNSA